MNSATTPFSLSSWVMGSGDTFMHIFDETHAVQIATSRSRQSSSFDTAGVSGSCVQPRSK